MGKDIAANPPLFLFTYTTKHLAMKDKVRFYYALKGRDGKSGICKQYKIERLAKTVLLVPPKAAPAVEEFLVFWKCQFTKRKIIIEPVSKAA